MQTLLRAELISWAGESIWSMQPADDGSQQFLLSGPAFGAFDHKLLPHPTRTQVWSWLPAQDRFIKTAETVSPSQTLRQQVNAGEAWLRQGAYELAEIEYRSVLENAQLQSDGVENEPDWRVLAHYRLGQVLALLERPAEARAELEQAAAVGGAIGQLALAFRDAYTDGESLPAAWMAPVQAVDLAQQIYDEQAGNLGFPIDAFGVQYIGLAAAAYLDRHAEAADGSAESLQEQWSAWGLPVSGLWLGDLDGDGRRDGVFITDEPAGPEGVTARARATFRRGERWQVIELAQAAQLRLVGSRSLPEGGEAVILGYPEDYQPAELGFALHEGAAVTYDVTGDALTPRAIWPWPQIGVD